MADHSTLTLAAETRTLTGKQVRQLRNVGKLPAVAYGNDKASVSITLDTKEFLAAYKEAGTNSLINLTVDGKSLGKVIVHELQTDETHRVPLHVDFYQVNLKEKLQISVPLEITGVAPAVDIQGGTMNVVKDEVSIECLPNDLIHSITVDISVLATFEDAIHVSDLVVPASVTILDEPETALILINAPRSEAELAELDEPVVPTDVSEPVEGTSEEAPAEA